MRTIESRQDLKVGARGLISVVGMLALIVGFGVLLSRPAHAEIQNDLVGFATNHVFESAEAGEHIDAMTGNLMLTIPIGPRYKLNDTFGYGLTLYYNSKIWEHDCLVSPSSVHPCNGKLPASRDYGLGFSMLPGRIYHNDLDKSYIYRIQLEDGAEHFFCASPPGYNPPQYYPPPNCEGGYTTDASHFTVLRHQFSSASDVGWQATMPDGRRIYFRDVPNSTTHEALATRIESAETRTGGSAAEWVQYHFGATEIPATRAITQITDSHGRVTTFHYDNYDPNHPRVKIHVPSFTSPGGSAQFAIYTLHLDILALKDPTSGITDRDSHAEAPDPQPFLTQIDFPGLTPDTDAQHFESYRFAYGTDDAHRYGYLLERTLPTGATIAYAHDIYETSDYHPYHVELIAKTLSMGVAPHRLSYRWTWHRFNVAGSTNPSHVEAVDAFGNATVYNFAESHNCGSNGCVNNWDDGLLTDVSTYAGPDADTSRLVRRVEYKWDAEPDLVYSPSFGRKMFQYRSPSDQTNWAHFAAAVNARQVEQRTIIPGQAGSPGHTVTVKSSNWTTDVCPQQQDEYLDDVLYRKTIWYFPGPGCLYPLYTEVRDTMGNVVSRVDRRYVQRRVQCEVRRNSTHKSDNLSGCTDSSLDMGPGDVATINTFHPQTSVTTSTEVKGGDGNPDARTTNMAYLASPLDGQPTGYLMTKTYDTLSWKAVDRIADPWTGLTAQSKDSAGNMTSYTWDGLGRLTSIVPDPPEKPTVITYTNLRETHVRQELSAGNYVETVYLYDDLGRLTTTKRRNATGTLDVQKTEYDIAGRVTRKSEWAPDGSADAAFKWTTYDYTMYTDLDAAPGMPPKHADPLGRIHGVTTPDDLTPSTPTTETSYSGTVTTVKIRDIRGWVTATGTDIDSTTVYTNDALGRLVSVDSPGNGVDAKYLYDAGDNLTEVRLNDPATPAQVQVRQFQYDMLGQLRTASNPESGTVQYTSYDARGNLLSYTDARQQTFKMSYDHADRLLTRVQTVGNSVVGYTDRNLAVSTYDAANGHLVQQDSYQIVGSSSVPVSRVQFGYGAVNSQATCPAPTGGYTGLNGRMSWQKTIIQPWGVDLQTDYCQDALGMPTAISYPGDASSERTRSQLASTYQNGYLMTLWDSGRGNQYITHVNYTAGGVPVEIDRVSNKDLVLVDDRNRPKRYQSIGYGYVPSGGGAEFVSCQTVHANPYSYPALAEQPCGDPEGGGGGGGGWAPYTIWDSGNFEYDMAGNVKKIGSEEYYYDPMNRLVHSSIPGVGLTYSLDYAFDAFGNMTSQVKTLSNNPSSPTTRTYAAAWQTNRLSGPSYAYDENGNMTADADTGYVFDGQNRLREVMDPEKGRIGNYDYDASGYRVRVEADGTETFFFRDASGQVLSEFQRPIGVTDPPVWNKDYVYAFGKAFALAKNRAPVAPKRSWATPTGSDTTVAARLTLHWSTVDEPDIIGYVVEKRWWKTDTDTTERVMTASIAAPLTTWNDTYSSYTASRCLTYLMRAVDSAGNVGDLGPQLVVCPQGSDPPAPSNVRTTPGDRSVTVRWDPVSGSNLHVLGYFVERQRPDGSGFDRLNNDLLTVPEFLDNGLVNGSTYWYRVRTVDTSNRPSADPAPPALAGAVSGIPIDNVAPGKITDVFAEPDRAAGRIIVSWKRGVDPDVGSYAVYRRTDDLAPTTDVPICSVAVVSGQEQVAYSCTDPNVPPGTTYYFSVKAFDTAVPVNVSSASDRVSARARGAVSTPPVIVSVTFTVNTNGINSSDGIPQGLPNDNSSGARINQPNIHDEDDDVMQATITFQPGSPTAQAYRVYRKAPDEPHFTRVPDQPMEFGATSRVFNDPTIVKGDYTYFVAGVNSQGDETAGTTLPVSGSDRFVHHGRWADVSVRNVIVTDGRGFYSTDNKHSRLATVQWSRVTEPELVGYNVYRMCAFHNNCASVNNAMEHFACESVWIRLNTTPVPAEQRFFQDSSTGGLQGCFNYAVRPVGPGGVEGPISKIVAADLAGGAMPETQATAAISFAHFTKVPWASPPASMLPERQNCANPPCPYCPNCPWSNCTPPVVCPPGCHSPCPNYGDKYADDILNLSPGPGSNELPGINTIQRGTSDPSHSVPVPTAVTQYILEKNEPESVDGRTKFARVSWAMVDPPSDLLGFHVETAGSPSGPWQRLTKHPVAWWERNYVSQGVGMARCGAYSGHTECLRYRVIAVDEAGNESEPSDVASTTETAICPMTPAPPKNLRASSATSSSGCATLLEWDASTTGATEYYVYRTLITSVAPYFYDTQRVVVVPGQAPSYTETGDPRSDTNVCSDSTCGFLPVGSGQCSGGYLAAYYVTARKSLVEGGESPRSNLVFWKCDTSSGGGYSKTLTEEDPASAIASLGIPLPGESLACWNTDGPSLQDPTDAAQVWNGTAPPTLLTAAPMTHLGTLSLDDPPWTIFDLHTDHLGSVRAVTTYTGAGTTHHDYFPFGEKITSQLSHNTHQYTGHERDRETGLDYMLARYYRDSLPRFLSPDPLGGTAQNPQSWNRYAYVLGNPMKLVDPSGQSSVMPDGPIGGWWQSGPGGSVGWGHTPCVMCFQRGDGWTDDQWTRFTTGTNAFRKTIKNETKEHFTTRYNVDIDEYYTPGKGPVVNAAKSIDGSRAETRGGWFGNGITMDLSDLFNPDGSVDQKILEHATLHESEHFANTPWYGRGPIVKEPIGVADKARALIGAHRFATRHDDSVIGYWAEVIQFGSPY